MIVDEKDSDDRAGCSPSLDGCFAGILMDIGLDGVMEGFGVDFWGVAGCASAGFGVDADSASEEL